MKRIAALFCLAIIILASLPSPSAAQNTSSDAPYIYYYSDFLNAFVIERADGTDSRTIGDGLIPEETNTISGPGWSPSREWLAWTATYRFRTANTGRLPFVLNANGEYLAQFDDYVDATLEWSPTEDVLLAVGVKGTFELPDESNAYMSIPMTFTIEMVDVTTNSVIAAFEIPQVVHISNEIGKTTIYYPAMSSIAWSTDGQQVAIGYYAEEPEPEATVNRHYLILGRDGTMREVVQEFTMAEYSLLSVGNTSGIHAGKIASFLENDTSTLIIEDILTGVQYETTVEPRWIRSVLLNPTENTALLNTKPEDCLQSSCPTEIWLWDMQNDSPTLVLQNATIDDPEWSPDGQYALILDTNMSPYVLTLHPFSVDRLDNVSHLLEAVWVDSHQVRVIEGDSNAPTASEYDLETRGIIRTFPNNLGYDQHTVATAQWSPDGEKIVFIVFDIGIYDMRMESQIMMGTDGRSLNSVYGGGALWHQDSEWFLTWENATVAGGGSINAWMGVSSADGAVNRDLTFCIPFDPCMGWLPDNVDLSLLPEGQPRSVIPEPERSIRGNNWTFSLSWSPNGRQIVGATEEVGSGNNTVFDVETHAILQEFPDLNEGEYIEWQTNNDGTYVAAISTQSQDIPPIGQHSFAVSPDGRYAVVIFENAQNPVLYDIQCGEVIYEINDIFSVIANFSPDSRLVVLSGYYNPVQIRNAMTGDLITSLNTVGTALAFSPDGQTLAVASSWDIQLWDVERLLELNAESSEE